MPLLMLVAIVCLLLGPEAQAFAQTMGGWVSLQQAKYAPADAPIDANSDAKTKETLFYLQNIIIRSDHRFLVGQIIGAPACCSSYETPDYGAANYIEGLTALSGKTPGIVGGNYLDYNLASPGTPVDYSVLNGHLIRYANAGSLIEVSYVAMNPWTGGGPKDGTVVGQFDDLINPNKAVHAAWIAQLDNVAIGLSSLQAAGVPVIWRPFMEVNGTWFWWSLCKPTKAQFTAVWKHMVDYLTITKGLHNLLWLYAPNVVGASLPLDMYPGKDVVDIVGVDDYSITSVFYQYGEMLNLGKPIFFGERGPPAPGGANTFVTLMRELTNSYPMISAFQAWIHPFSIVENPGAMALMTDAMAATQADASKAMSCLLNATTRAQKEACVLL